MKEDIKTDNIFDGIINWIKTLNFSNKLVMENDEDILSKMSN